MTADPDTPTGQPARKRAPRWLLYAPFVVIAAMLVVYGAYWLVAGNQLESRLEQRVDALRQAGYQVAAEGRAIDGFPFRMRVAYRTLRVASPGGWAVEAPELKAEAYLHDLGHWVIVAPQGLTVTRPRGGPLAIRGEALRASVAGVNRPVWRVVIEAVKPTFTPGPGTAPFSLASADRIELGLRPAPDGSADGQAGFSLLGGKSTPGTAVWRLAADKPVTAALDVKVVKPAAFKGANWSQAVRAWADAGGQLQLMKAEAQGGGASLWGRGGTLSVGSGGRLAGAVPLEMRQATQGLAALAEGGLDPNAARSAAVVAAARDQGGSATLNLVFQAGVATLGPVMIGPSPRVY